MPGSSDHHYYQRVLVGDWAGIFEQYRFCTNVPRPPESLRGRQLFQGIDEGDAEWLEMALIGHQDGQPVRGGSGGNVLETGIMGTRAVENEAGVTCFFNIEWQDASGMEMRSYVATATDTSLSEATAKAMISFCYQEDGNYGGTAC